MSSPVAAVMLLKWTFRLFLPLEINPLQLTREKALKPCRGGLNIEYRRY